MSKNKDMKNMIKDAGILLIITLIAGLALGFVYELTKEPIRIQQEKAIQKACQAVFAQAESFTVLEYTPSAALLNRTKEEGITIGTIFEAKDASGNSVGYVVESTSLEGYGGKITLYAGITQDGMLNGISILSIAETPGLGMNAHSVLVPQFENVPATMFVYTKSGSTSSSEIDAISGATITTKAIVNAVNGAVMVVTEEIMKGGN